MENKFCQDISEFWNKRVLIMGLGVQGRGEGIVTFFARQGAKITITDLKSKQELAPTLKKIAHIPCTLVLGKHRFEDFRDTDLVIKNPGVSRDSPYLKEARRHRVPIDTDVGIFFKLWRGKVIGITGTKGKSTTTNFIFRILRKGDLKPLLAGVPGTSILSHLNQNTKRKLLVTELSSWDLEGLIAHKKSPHIAVITNVFPDHLNTYTSFQKYIDAKKIIFRFQKPYRKDLVILNYDNPITRRFAKDAPARVLFFSQKENLKKIPAKKRGAWLDNGVVVSGRTAEPLLDFNEFRTTERHNIENILGAITLARALHISPRTIKSALALFRALPGRLEHIATIRGVRFINDTCATVPIATEHAIETFKKNPLILITGGVNKNVSYGNLAKKIAAYNITRVILLPGSASDALHTELTKRKWRKYVLRVATLKDALRTAVKRATSGDTVLFSPAAASFNLFKNEFDRGNQFVRLVKILRK